MHGGQDQGASASWPARALVADRDVDGKGGRASAVDVLKDPTQDDIDKDDGSDTNPCHFEHGDGISLFRHSGQSGGAAFEVRRKGGKHFVLHSSRLSVIRLNVTCCNSLFPAHRPQPSSGCRTYRVIEGAIIPRIIVDINRHRSEGGNFGGERVEECIILPVCSSLATSTTVAR